ncbi:YheC/YheD family protein [Metabacillus halosaccharovorans]|uniref:YheC/YheD family protein n=1 Tax=Metabacillus halosaccharovorans TaxID=930124 RepID=UPI00373513D5
MHHPKINNKFHKHQLFLEDSKLAKFVPETKIFSKKNLFSFIEKNNKIVVKPSMGSLGKGVIFITEIGVEKYELLLLNKKKYILGQTNLFIHLKRRESKHIPNIIQNFLSLATFSERPIDLRYIVQSNNFDWVVTGKYAKIAKDGYAITNFTNGASIFSVEDALKKSDIKNLRINDLLTSIETITIAASKCLSKYFPNNRIWGFDIGIDKSGNIWIIEANSAPQIKGFLELEALKPMYNTIETYKRKYKKNT